MNRLLELRNEKNMSQRDMAKEMNISQGTYNNWENSNTQPSIEQLIALARFFGVSVDYLIGNSDDFGVIRYTDIGEELQELLRLYLAATPPLQEAVKIILREQMAKNDGKRTK